MINTIAVQAKAIPHYSQTDKSKENSVETIVKNINDKNTSPKLDKLPMGISLGLNRATHKTLDSASVFFCI